MRIGYKRIKKIFWSLPISYKNKRKIVDKIKNIMQLNKHIDENEKCEEINNSIETQKEYIMQIINIPIKDKSKFVNLNEASFFYKKGYPKLVAYYLPQFYPFKENDEWWGKGTTEWNNVNRAIPQFIDHYQPRFPGELGYYDLRLKDNMKRQVELAKNYGIYGFCFYYYWFDGKRLLDKPLDMLFEDKNINCNFCICWANENWTRRFDGTNSEVLMSISETEESYIKFFESIMPYISDERYIQVNEKPVIIIYKPSHMPNSKKVISNWRRKYFKATGKELYIIGVHEWTFKENILEYGYDAITEFQPGSIIMNLKDINSKLHFIRDDFKGKVYDYNDILDKKVYAINNKIPKVYKAVMPMWDNTARKNNAGTIFHNSSPELYEKWLGYAVDYTMNNKELDGKFVFINAWNEWGEGAYLEPDKKYGYAYLQATRNVIENINK